jgi:transposase
MQKASTKAPVEMKIINGHAAGIDVGSRSHFVATGQSAGDVREFGCYTADLHELCQWLKSGGITAAALESTGNYWQSLFVMLQDYGLGPVLVNGKFTKNAKGRKSDVQDCQWIQKLRTFGMLEGSFLPDLSTERLRSYCRHRQTLIADAGPCIQKVQQAPRRANIRLDVAIKDVTGVSGQAIIGAVLAGERGPDKLAGLADYRVKKSREEIAMALTGSWREEYIFELRQCFDLYKYVHLKVNECDREIEKALEEKIAENERGGGGQRREFTGKASRKSKNGLGLDVHEKAFQLTGGIDLSAIEGVSVGTILAIISEVGPDLGAFPSAKHFAGWLHLVPDNKVSGGRVISSKTAKGKNNLAKALRQAANIVGTKVKTGALHHFYKRIAYKKGGIQAVTATARKIAVIIWNMLTKKEAYRPMVQEKYLASIREGQLKNIQKKIQQLNILPEELQFSPLIE